MNDVRLPGLVVDLDAEPQPEEGYTIEYHRKVGSSIWRPEAISLYFSPLQQGANKVEGHALRQALWDRSLCSANALDFYLKNTDRIPEEWDEWSVFFWGTIYRSCDTDKLYVRCLAHDRDGWFDGLNSLDGPFSRNSPAAIFT